MNFTDYVSKKQRLSKKQPSADFRLADNDDFFGYKKDQGDLTLTQVLLLTFIGLPILWFLLVILLELTPNI